MSWARPKNVGITNGVADVLLDGPAVAADHIGAQLEVARQGVTHLLGVALFGKRREADDVREQDGDQPALGDRGCGQSDRPRRRARGCDPSRVGQRRGTFATNFSPGSFDAPHAGQTTASGAAHSEQNLRPGRFSVPQLEQITWSNPLMSAPVLT
jgi:hypothetical protein